MTQGAQSELRFAENEIREIALDQVKPDKNQVRKEFQPAELEALAESIKSNGQIQPILITAGKDGKYQIVDGERRWRAYKILAKQAKDNAEADGRDFLSIRAIYVEKDKRLLGIVGNIARNSYNPMETADALTLLKKILGEDGGEASDDSIGKHIGKSRSLVAEYRSLLKLPLAVQKKAREDSCVPFNKLKSLAASKDDDDVKITNYERLHKRYSDSESEEEAKPATRQSMATRKIAAVHKKIDSVNNALGNIKFDNVDDSVKENFIESLRATIERAESFLKELSSQ